MGQRRYWKWTRFSLSNAGWNPKKSEENIKELRRAEKMKPGRLKLSGATVQPRCITSDKHWESDKEIIIIAVSGYENMDNTLYRLLSATYTNGEIWNIPLGNNT